MSSNSRVSSATLSAQIATVRLLFGQLSVRRFYLWDNRQRFFICNEQSTWTDSGKHVLTAFCRAFSSSLPKQRLNVRSIPTTASRPAHAKRWFNCCVVYRMTLEAHPLCGSLPAQIHYPVSYKPSAIYDRLCYYFAFLFRPFYVFLLCISLFRICLISWCSSLLSLSLNGL